MTINGKPPVLVVVQLTGGNDFMNTLVPYNNGVYYDARPTVVIPQEEVLPINDTLGFNPNLAPLKEMYDAGNVASRTGNRLRELEQVPLQGDGHLAHLRARQGGHRGMAWPHDQGDRP